MKVTSAGARARWAHPFRMASVFVAAVVLVGVGGGASFSSAPSLARGPTAAAVTWMTDLATLRRIAAVDPAATSATLGRPDTFMVQDPHSTPNRSAVAVARFRSFADFQASFGTGGLKSGFGWVLYDNENWSDTPIGEQADPATFEARFVALAHANGLKVILAPALDLLARYKERTPLWTSYLNHGFAGFSASADAYEIQAQSLEGTPAYAAFVHQAVTQARATSANVELLAGLSTARVGTGAQMYQDVQTTRASVSGYWMNDPVVSGVAHPAVAAAALALLGAT